MPDTITGTSDTRREAETAVERLVREHGLDRPRIQTFAAGGENTSATVVSGAAAADAAAGERPDGVGHTRIAVVVEAGKDRGEPVMDAFRKCGAGEIEAGDGSPEA